MEGTKKVSVGRTLKFLTIILVMAAVASSSTLVSGETTPQKLLRLAIYIAAFAVLPLGLRLWPSLSGRKHVALRRWIVFFAVLLLVYSAATFLLPSFFEKRPSIERLFSLVEPEWYPAFVLPVVLVVYLLMKRYGPAR
jgi:hypothetical protein